MNKKTNNPILDMLLRKKAQQAKNMNNQFNPVTGKQMKGQVSNTGPNVMRKQGRGS